MATAGFPLVPAGNAVTPLDREATNAPYQGVPIRMDPMFSKTADPTAAPSSTSGTSRPATGSNANRSILGNDLKITGEITSAGTGEVFGEIDGNIAAEILTVGQEGRISGSVKAGMIEVKGHVDGKITTDSFTMRATAQVAADVTYSTVVIESGAQVEGRFSKPKA